LHAALEFLNGLIVERPQDLLRMRECPCYGCEPAGVRGIVDWGLLSRAPGVKCADEVGTDGVRDSWEVLVCDDLADSVKQCVLL
jgi:hypothetical protein